MTQQRSSDPRRDRNRWPRSDGPGQSGPGGRTEPRRDPGAYIGRMPERATETIPGGVGPKDERVSAVATQPGPVRGEPPASAEGTVPEGHREAANVTDDTKREAGQNR
jgi:hypothetical protein